MARGWWFNATRGVPVLLVRVAYAQETLQLGHPLRAMAAMLPAMLLIATTRESIYNILWGLVFAFATLNILSLGARHVDPRKTGLSFGEVLAILVVLMSIVLLGWELLYQFHILPFRVVTSE